MPAVDLIDALGDLEEKEDLELDDIESYEDEEFEHLCQSIYENTALLKVSLSLLQVPQMDDPTEIADFIILQKQRVSKIFSVLENHRTIEEFKLFNIESYGDEEWDRLCLILQKNKSLKKFSLSLLDLPYEFFYTNDLKLLSTRQLRVSQLLSSIEIYSELQVLTLSVGYVDKDMLVDIVRFIERKKSIRELNLPYNQLTDWHMKFLSGPIHDSKNMHSVNVSNNILFKKSINYLKHIAVSESVTQVNVSYNNLGNSALLLLITQKTNHYPKKTIDFDLSGNRINKYGMINLNKKLVNLNSVFELSTSKLLLNDNTISCDGGEALSKILENGFEFNEIHLRNTGINDKIVYEICSSMIKTIKNPFPISVRVLNLEGITIGEKGADAISRLIKENISLEEISISYNRISNYNKIKIAKKIESSSFLKKFNCTLYRPSNKYKKSKAIQEFIKDFLEIFRNNLTLETINLCEKWSTENIKTYSSIILENFESLTELLLGAKKYSRKESEIIPELNICNTFINRIENYYQFDHKRDHDKIEDPLKVKLFSLKLEFKCMKNEFICLSNEVSLYEDVVHKNHLSTKTLFDGNLNKEINSFIGKRLDKLFLTQFMFENFMASRKIMFEEEKCNNFDDKKYCTEKSNMPKNQYG